MINTNNLNQARKEIQKLKKEKKEVIVYAQNDIFNRKIFENKDVDVILGVEFQDTDVKSKYGSGLNEVLCKLAKQNSIKIAIDVFRIIKLEKIKKAKILSKIIKNIFLCKKSNVEIFLFGKNYNKQDALSFFISLGSNTKQAKKAVNFIG